MGFHTKVRVSQNPEPLRGAKGKRTSMKKLARLLALTGLVVTVPALAGINSCLSSAAQQLNSEMDLKPFKGKTCGGEILLGRDGRLQSISGLEGDPYLCAATAKAASKIRCNKPPKEAKDRRLAIQVRP